MIQASTLGIGFVVLAIGLFIGWSIINKFFLNKSSFVEHARRGRTRGGGGRIRQSRAPITNCPPGLTSLKVNRGYQCVDLNENAYSDNSKIKSGSPSFVRYTDANGNLVQVPKDKSLADMGVGENNTIKAFFTN